MHLEARQWVADCVQRIPPPVSVIEFGSRNINGGVRELFPLAYYTGVDVSEGPGVDVVADAAVYRHDHLVDVVVSTEMLEHCPTARAACENAWFLLKPGGVFILTAAGETRPPHSGIDENPIRPWEHYRNVTRTDLESWLHRFKTVEIDEHKADIRAIAWKGEQ